MARQPRNERRPGTYHVWARGNNQEMIFLDEEDRGQYLILLKLVLEEYGWRILHYTLMGNHLHLVVQTTKPTLGAGMRVLQGCYARWFNRKRGRTGHLFGDRFGSTEINDDDYFRNLIRYLALNPVEAALAPEIAVWPWDSTPHVFSPKRSKLVDVRRTLRAFAEAGVTTVEAFYAWISDPSPP